MRQSLLWRVAASAPAATGFGFDAALAEKVVDVDEHVVIRATCQPQKMCRKDVQNVGFKIGQCLRHVDNQLFGGFQLIVGHQGMLARISRPELYMSRSR